MKEYTTELGYYVKETIDGLDVYEDGEFVCELTNKTLAHYTYNGKVDDDKLETDIKEEIDCQDFLENMNGMY
jgi:hypothetical protein